MDRLQEVFEASFKTFKAHLTRTFNVEITDEEGLKAIFLDQIDSLIEAALDGDRESGCLLDEMYGEDIFNCVRSTGDDE